MSDAGPWLLVVTWTPSYPAHNPHGDAAILQMIIKFFSSLAYEAIIYHFIIYSFRYSFFECWELCSINFYGELVLYYICSFNSLDRQMDPILKARFSVVASRTSINLRFSLLSRIELLLVFLLGCILCDPIATHCNVQISLWYQGDMLQPIKQFISPSVHVVHH